MTEDCLSTPVLCSDHDALQLLRSCRRMLHRRLRLYGMQLQPADLHDIATDALISALETMKRRTPTSANEVRKACWLAVRAKLVDYIRERVVRDNPEDDHGDDPFRDGYYHSETQMTELYHLPDTQPTEDKLPAYVARLCRSVGELRAAVVLSGQTFDGRTFLEMSNDDAARELNISVRGVQRMKETLRIRFALFAPPAVVAPAR
jgi:DNA-directed RNA polymerase specialized sigma24 family protein